MKKKISLLVVVTLIISMLSMTGCGGGSGETEKSPCEGKWLAVSAQAMGISVPVEESFGGSFELDVKSGGKVTVTVGEDTGDGEWSLEEDQFTLGLEGEEMIGTLDGDTIIFDNMMDMDVKVIFAREGTDAMNPDLYLTDEESSMLGEWASESVEELLGDGPQTSMDGVDNINDALRLSFTSDRNVAVVYKGQEIGTFPWTVALGYCSIESEDPMINVTINDDGTLEVDYSDDEDYYTFHCVKSDGE